MDTSGVAPEAGRVFLSLREPLWCCKVASTVEAPKGPEAPKAG